MDGRAIPTFLRQAMGGKPITVFGDGAQTRSFCYVDDLVDGLVRLAFSGEHTPVNLGNPSEMSLRELAETIIEVTGSRSEVVYQALPIDDPKVRKPDIAKARRLLHWEPQVELRDGLARVWEFERHNRPHSLTGLPYEKPALETRPADAADAAAAEELRPAAAEDLRRAAAPTRDDARA